MVINPSVPAKTVPEFIAYAKANPGKINIGSSGSGSVFHVFGERFKMMTGINLVHVRYRGGYVPDLLGGQVQVVFGTISSCIQYIRGGMLRALAVTTATRSDELPDIPTMAEFVPGYEASQWYGVGSPKDVPAEVIDKLNNEINAIAADPLTSGGTCCAKETLAHSNLEQCQSTASRFLGQCQHTDWIGLCRAMLDRPVGTYGDDVQWAASGGHPSNRAKAPPLAPSTWNRNPC